MKANRRVEIHIDELILYGFAASDRNAIADALIRELDELAANRNFNVNSLPGNLDSIHAPRITTSFQEKPALVGKQIAASVYKSLSSSNKNGRGQ